MKKLTLLIFIVSALFMVSCSDDTNQVPPAPTATTLAKTIETTYSIYDTIPLTRSITEYENGKPILTSTYNEDGNLYHYLKYDYNSNNLLIKQTLHYASGSEAYTTFCYDDLGRLTEAVPNNGFNTNYTYDTNTITMTKNGIPTLYQLNSNDLVIANGTNINYIYDGNDIITVISLHQNGAIQQFNFSYDNEHDKSLLGLESLMGSYKPNTFFLYNYHYYSFIGRFVRPTDKYVTQWPDAELNVDNGISVEYFFNELGLPVHHHQTSLANNSIYIDTEYIYE